MTALDRALMKAYRRQGAGGPHASFALRDELPPPPHSNELNAEEPPPPDLVAGPPPIISSPLAASSTATPAVVAGPPPVAIRASAAPALELEHFDWPPLIESLREAVADEWPALFEQVLDGARTLLITGCQRGEGRTSVALLVASLLAAHDLPVALVDADFVRPQLAARLGVLAAIGWTEAIAQGLPLAEAMIESLADHVVLLPLPEAAGAPMSVDAATVQSALAALRSQCGLVCIDAGPQLDASDTIDALLGAGIDAALVVHDARHRRVQQSHAVGRRLAQAGIDRWAILENFARVSHV